MKKHEQQEDIKISTDELQRVIQQSTGRAGGPDRRTPDHWNMLPEEIFKRLADVKVRMVTVRGQRWLSVLDDKLRGSSW